MSLYDVLDEGRNRAGETGRLAGLRKLHSAVAGELAAFPEEAARESAGSEKVCALYRQEAKALEAWYPPPPAVERAAEGLTAACGIQSRQGGPGFRAGIQRALAELQSLLVDQAHLALEAREQSWWRRVLELGGLNALLLGALGGLVWWRRSSSFEAPREPEPRATSLSSPPQWMRAAIESSPEGIVMVDPGGEIRAVNPAAEQLLGWDRGDLIGTPVADVIPAYLTRQPDESRGDWRQTAVRSRDGVALPEPRDISWFRRDDPFQAFTILHVHPGAQAARPTSPPSSLPEAGAVAAVPVAAPLAPGDVDTDSLQQLENQILLVTGYGEVALSNLGAGDPMRADIEQLARAGARAALLCREATMSPAVVDRQPVSLNGFLKSFEHRLRALTGEEADIIRRVDSVAGSVEADPELLEQTLLGLALHSLPSIREPHLVRLSSSLGRIEMSLHTRGAVNLQWRPEAAIKPARAVQWLHVLGATVDHEVADKGGHRFRLQLQRLPASPAANGAGAAAASPEPPPQQQQQQQQQPETAVSPS